MIRLHRRKFLASAIAAGILGSGCGQRAGVGGEYAGQELRIFCYAGGHEAAMRNVFVPVFETTTGATATLFPGWWDGIAKLKAAGSSPPFDLIISDATQGFPAAREGLFAQLNLERIPNHKNLVPQALDHWIFKERYGITYPDSVMTIGYRRTGTTDKPSSWSDLLRPDLKGKLGLYNAYYMSLFTFACMRAGLEGKPGHAYELIHNDLEGTLQFARKHRDQVKLWWPNSTDMILALARNDCEAGNMHSPEYLQAIRDQGNRQLAAEVPPTDRAFVQVFWSVPANSQKQDLAEKAIDLLFSDEVQLGFARTGSATAIVKVAEQIASEDPVWKSFYPHTLKQFDELRYYPYDLYSKHRSDIEDTWDRTILRKG